VQAAICAGIESARARGRQRRRFLSDEWTRDAGGGGLTASSRAPVIEKGGVRPRRVRRAHPRVRRPAARHRHDLLRRRRLAGPAPESTPSCRPCTPTSATSSTASGAGSAAAPTSPRTTSSPRTSSTSTPCGSATATTTPASATTTASASGASATSTAHRGEHRGVGGIFFDNLFVDEPQPGHEDRLLAFIRDGGLRFLDAYLPIARRRVDTPYNPEQRRWQELRRGRYVEFNLLYDRGTTFGLKTGGRTESILMSLPPHVQWGYCEEPEPGTPEHDLLLELRRPVPARRTGPTE
jgi:coproporphyrinogen III oxidase